MKKIFLVLFLAVSVGYFLSSCYYDKEDLLYGSYAGPCTDTTGTISYTQKLVPMFTQYCYYCHTGAFPSGGIQMGNYTADKALAQSGKLYGSISHAAGFSGMPKGMASLTRCQQAMVKKWIDSGMLNN
jgi:hypothetical protein